LIDFSDFIYWFFLFWTLARHQYPWIGSANISINSNWNLAITLTTRPIIQFRFSKKATKFDKSGYFGVIFLILLYNFEFFEFWKFLALFWPVFWSHLSSKKVSKIYYIDLNAIFEHICEFSQNAYVCRCTFFVLVLCTGLKWAIPAGGQLFFVEAFGG
jgi:hypothetical protein